MKTHIFYKKRVIFVNFLSFLIICKNTFQLFLHINSSNYYIKAGNLCFAHLYTLFIFYTRATFMHEIISINRRM